VLKLPLGAPAVLLKLLQGNVLNVLLEMLTQLLTTKGSVPLFALLSRVFGVLFLNSLEGLKGPYASDVLFEFRRVVEQFVVFAKNAISNYSARSTAPLKRVEGREAVKAMSLSTNGGQPMELLQGRQWQSNAPSSGNHFVQIELADGMRLDSWHMRVSYSDGNYTPNVIEVTKGPTAASLTSVYKQPIDRARFPDGRVLLIDKSQTSMSDRVFRVWVRDSFGGCDCRIAGMTVVALRGEVAAVNYFESAALELISLTLRDSTDLAEVCCFI
jgi:hypothetical protein